MSSVKSVIITLPKGVPKAIPRNEPSRNALPKLNFTTSILVQDKARMDGRKTASGGQQEETSDGDGDGDGDVTSLLEPVDTRVRGKKRRLDHLTWEEKLQRKKLKNRVAAQTSRDRKKARLDELEETVRTQKERNELLTQECAMLRSQNELLTSQNEWLLNENKRLRNERDAVRNTLTDQQQTICSACRTRVDGAVPSLGSAVSPNDPLPQGGTAQSASRPTRTPRATLLLKFLIYFLWKGCSAPSKAPTSSDSKISKSWRRASYEVSAQKLRQILRDQMNKCPSTKLPLKNLTIQKHWWGRHQKMWKPIELVEAQAAHPPVKILPIGFSRIATRGRERRRSRPRPRQRPRLNRNRRWHRIPTLFTVHTTKPPTPSRLCIRARKTTAAWVSRNVCRR